MLAPTARRSLGAWALKRSRSSREAKRDLVGGINRHVKTKDGHISISAHTETFWQRLCQAIGLYEPGTHPRYHSRWKRSQPVKDLVAIVEAALQAKSAEELGEPTGETLCGLGYAPDQVAELKRTKAV